MIAKDEAVKTVERMKRIRLEIVREYPFFGEMLMNLHMAVAKVGTACTDGKHIFLDFVFSERLNDGELTFIFLHELMHVVFLHCYRREGRCRERWNIACDLVVNSNILMAMGLEDYVVDGKAVMHTIRGREAGYYTAEHVYEMLGEGNGSHSDSEWKKSIILDSHEIWTDLEAEYNQEALDRWTEIANEATKKWYGVCAGIAGGCLKRYKLELYKAQLKWKQIVRDFIRYRNCEEDYGFRPPDRRFEGEEFIYPGLNTEEAEIVEHLWFFIDKSGSISKKMLMEIIQEIEFGIRQVQNLQGLVSFFDVAVSKPILFKNLREFLKIGIPLPDGGTSFHHIFEYVLKHRRRYNPVGIIILTDGYAKFPKKNIIPTVPVLWIILDHQTAKPPFGKCVYIDSKLYN